MVDLADKVSVASLRYESMRLKRNRVRPVRKTPPAKHHQPKTEQLRAALRVNEFDPSITLLQLRTLKEGTEKNDHQNTNCQPYTRLGSKSVQARKKKRAVLRKEKQMGSAGADLVSQSDSADQFQDFTAALRRRESVQYNPSPGSPPRKKSAALVNCSRRKNPSPVKLPVHIPHPHPLNFYQETDTSFETEPKAGEHPALESNASDKYSENYFADEYVQQRRQVENMRVACCQLLQKQEQKQEPKLCHATQKSIESNS